MRPQDFGATFEKVEVVAFEKYIVEYKLQL